MPVTALAIGAGVGLLKSLAVDMPKAERQRKLAAETARYNPWTNAQAGPVQEADPIASAGQFGLAGAQFKSGMDQDKLNAEIAERVSKTKAYTPINVTAQAGAANPYAGLGNLFAQPPAAQPAPQQPRSPYSLGGNYNYGATPFGNPYSYY